MEARKLGKNGPLVSALGLGCMGMSEFYGERDDAVSIATIHRAIDIGVTFFDTADMYGVGHNEQLVGKALKGKRDRVILATKFGNVRGEDGSFRGVNGHPDYVHAACDASLKRLGVDHIDLYYQHRVDPTVPIEATVEAMAELVEEGKVRYIGLSEASPRTIRRAAAVTTITALQTEYSLWTRDIEDEILPTCRELGIGFVAYSPIGRGFLSGRFKPGHEWGNLDYRSNHPRFQHGNIEHNDHLARELEKMAAKKHCTAAQLALAWILDRGNDVVPIPGTKKIAYIEENCASVGVALTDAEREELERVFAPGVTAGDRYHASGMKTING